MRIVDLSIPIDATTPFYPGDPEPRVCVATTIARDGFNVSRLELGSHSGTHCDAPRHFLEDGLTLDQLPLERFVGAGVIFGRNVYLNEDSHAIEELRNLVHAVPRQRARA